MEKRLRKSKESVFFFLFGGIEDYLNIDPTLVRLATVLLVVCAGMSIWVYIVAAIVMPDPIKESNDEVVYTKDNSFY